MNRPEKPGRERRDVPFGIMKQRSVSGTFGPTREAMMRKLTLAELRQTYGVAELLDRPLSSNASELDDLENRLLDAIIGVNGYEELTTPLRVKLEGVRHRQAAVSARASARRSRVALGIAIASFIVSAAATLFALI